MAVYDTHVHPRSTDSTRARRVALGAVLLLPALFFCITSLALPTLRTLLDSVQKISMLGPAEPVGIANYQAIFSDEGARGALRVTLTIALVRLLAVAIIPPLLAAGAHGLGRAARIVTRLVFTAPLALFSLAVLAISWRLALFQPDGPLENLGRSLVSPATALGTLTIVDGLITLGLACGLGLVFYLAALRGGVSTTGERHTWRPVLITWLVGLLATAALSLQSFTLPYLLTSGGPASATTTLLLLQFKQTFQFFNMGQGAALSSLLLAPIVILGLVAGLLLILGNVRISLKPAAPRPNGAGRAPALLALALALLIAVPACVFGALPLLGAAFGSGGAPASDMLEGVSLARAQLNAWLPPLLMLIVQIPVVFLGALAIGGLRPLGRHSEWLLLPFCLWLFVTPAPISGALFQNAREAAGLNSLLGLVPPIKLSVPALVILTLLFKGQALRLEAQRASGQPASFFGTVVLPALPLAALLAVVSWALAATDLFWPLLVASDRELFPTNLLLATLLGQFSTTSSQIGPLLASATVPLFALLMVVYGAFGVFYLERVAIDAGPSDG